MTFHLQINFQIRSGLYTLHRQLISSLSNRNKLFRTLKLLGEQRSFLGRLRSFLGRLRSFLGRLRSFLRRTGFFRRKRDLGSGFRSHLPKIRFPPGSLEVDQTHSEHSKLLTKAEALGEVQTP
jgi:hypothetical protein